ncbi:MAG: tetratricopeptide repeat protein [Elusimicrobiota bacterium]|nr:tetratricopeptide repeat protein [Elusimicrobiota bacterium]
MDLRLWGASAFAFHLTNAALHAAATAAFFGVARRFLKEGALIAALLFAVHPLRVESVSWISERRDLLCGLFCCLSVSAHLDKKRGLSLLFFALAGLSKGMAVTLPLALTLLDRRWKDKLPHFALAFALAVTGFALQGEAGSSWSWTDHGLGGRLAQSSYSFAFYLWKSVVPTGLSPFYPLTVPLDPFAPAFLAAYAVVALAAWSRQRALALYAVFLLPVCGLFQFGAHLVADRYSYLATMPLAVVAGGWLSRRRALAAGLVLVYAVLCVRQQRHWASPTALWTRVLAVSPESGLALLHLGNEAARTGRPEDALDLFRRAQASDPACLPALAAADAAALKTRPVCRKARSNEGAALAQLGRYDEARAAFETALAADPSDAAAARNLARLRASGGRPAAPRTAARR